MTEQRGGSRKFDIVPHCPFCLPDPGLVLMSTPRLHVLVATGSIVPGHTVIVSKEHAPSLVNSGLRAAGADLLRVRGLVAAMSRLEYGKDTQFFEHGAGCQHEQSHVFCAHAHMHALPTSLTTTQTAFVVKQMRCQFTNYTAMTESETIAWYNSNREDEYFYFSGSGRHHVFYPDHRSRPAPRLFRRLFAQVLGLEPETVVNWEEQAEKTDLAMTAGRLRDALRDVTRSARPPDLHPTGGASDDAGPVDAVAPQVRERHYGPTD
ncbi:hypothetical protein V6V47_16010 [Micromonospora sp. CPCC 205539]|uniref:hypothetical protein n=1 Tax=Micromonospora sp. CPCC 205539 TaxID=3122408 RepID=UPI002FEFFDCD